MLRRLAPPLIVVGALAATPAKAQGDAADDRSYALACLPFGVGQFQNHDYGLGVAFAAGEALSLYYFQQRSAEAQQTSSTTNAYLQNNCAQPNSTPDQQYVCQQFVQSRQQYVNNLRQEAQTGLIAFSALWLGGAIEALVEDPPAAEDAPRQRKKKKHDDESDATRAGVWLVDAFATPSSVGLRIRF